MENTMLAVRAKKKKNIRRVDPTEPIWVEINPESNTYVKDKSYALSWMSSTLSPKDWKDSTLKYSRVHRKDRIRKFNYASIHPNAFMSVGKYCHAMNKGTVFSDDTNNWLKEKWKELEALGKDTVKEKKETVAKPVVSIQDRVKEKISEYIAEVENEVDNFMESGYKSDFDMYKWLMKNNIKSQPANSIADYYTPWRDELQEVLLKKDEQLIEGYSHMKPANIKKFIEFLSKIIDDASTWSSNQKTVRKTRVKKPPSVEKQVSKLNFAKEDKEFKLVSINPALIVGANQLWVFNTKYRMLTRYDAVGPAGLSVKGSTVQGYDEQSSVRKKIRKPENVLPNVLSGGIRVLKKIFEQINTKEMPINGRINSETILLRTIK